MIILAALSLALEFFYFHQDEWLNMAIIAGPLRTWAQLPVLIQVSADMLIAQTI